MSNVIQFGRKAIQRAIGRNRLTLSVSHLKGSISSTGDNRHIDDMSDRMIRIKESIERINELMTQIKEQETKNKKP